jgi:hypothetical protein
MPISDERIREFMVIVKKNYGKELSFEEAREWGQNIVNFYALLSKMHKNTDSNFNV